MIPIGLTNAIETGECVLFLGSGIGKYLKNSKGKSAPVGWELAKEISDEFGIDAGNNTDLTKVSEIVDIRKGRTSLIAFLKKRFDDFPPCHSKVGHLIVIELSYV